MERRKMTGEEITAGLANLNGWDFDGDFLIKGYEFENFAESLAFVNRIAELAEEADHHPDFAFGWGYAEIALATHDVEGLTQADFDLASKIDKL